MVCDKCGQRAYRYSWTNQLLGENNPRRRHGYTDPDAPGVYWFIICKPDCQLNAVRHAAFRLEEEDAAAMRWNWPGNREAAQRAIEELQGAWTMYDAYR